MAYNPDFSRNPKGQFNLDNSFLSVKSGSQAYLLEDELNEMQWIQNELRSQTMRSMMDSGFFYREYEVSDQNTSNDETIYVKSYGNSDLSSNAILYSIRSYIPVNINGYLFKMAGTYRKTAGNVASTNNNMLIKLPTPPASGTRKDLVYLEAWFENMEYGDNVPYFGGTDNSSIGTFNRDSRINVDTAKRIALKWKIRVASGKTDLTTIAPQGNMASPGTGVFQTAVTYSDKDFSNDKNLYISISNSGIVDGTIYALPMFLITRTTSVTVSAGNITNLMKQFPLNIEPHEIPYDNPAYPGMANLQDAMDTLLYFDPTVTITNNIGTVEIGTTISAVNLNWTVNKVNILSQTMNQGINGLSAAQRSYSVTSANITSDTTYTITVNDGTKSASGSTSVLFRHKRYWGVSSNTSLSNANILALSSELASNRTQSRTFNCSNQYIYFVWPTSFGNPIFNVNGLTNDAWVKTTISFTNSQGNTSSFDVYRSQYAQNGTGITISVS